MKCGRKQKRKNGEYFDSTAKYGRKILEIHWKKQVREEMSTSTADFEKTQSPSQ